MRKLTNCFLCMNAKSEGDHIIIDKMLPYIGLKCVPSHYSFSVGMTFVDLVPNAQLHFILYDPDKNIIFSDISKLNNPESLTTNLIIDYSNMYLPACGDYKLCVHENSEFIGEITISVKSDL